MMKLGISSFSEYLDYFKKNDASETEALISLMTTHHTFFFREFNHFEYLRNVGLEALVRSLKAKSETKIRILSAACSKGQEVYSLAMFFQYHLKALAPNMDYEIIGTDIDPESIEYAKLGTYPKEELKSVPQVYLANFWKPDGPRSENLIVTQDLKRKVKFEVQNLLEIEKFLKGQQFHIIFCRNVFIYFERPQIEAIVKQFIEHLHDDGYLFVGVSESITDYGLPLRSVGISIYEKIKKQVTKVDVIESKRNIKIKPYQVLVIDDSKTIHALMKKILTRDQGFEIAYSAMNGREAIEYLNKNSDKVEMITLDLHMPELDGIGFLKQYKDRSKPILIVSAIDRDDAKGPGRAALNLGAFDYVEKPSVENIERIGNEIRSKLTTGINLIKSVAKPQKTNLQITKPHLSTRDKSKTREVTLFNKTQKLGSYLGYKNQKIQPFKKQLIYNKTNTIRARTKELSSTPPSSNLLNKPLTSSKFVLKPSNSLARSSPESKNKLSEKTSNPTNSRSHTSKHESLINPLKPQATQVRVLIVDDSETVRKILKSLLSHDSRFTVVGETANPLEVEDLIRNLKPNLITLDIHMPEMDGVTLLKKYLPRYQIPTVMISSISMSEGKYVLDALETGAVDYIQKPNLSDISKQKDEICERLFIASKAKVRRLKTPSILTTRNYTGYQVEHGLVAIGSSTGGTEALRSIFEQLPETIPPILVVQHIPAVFSKALAERLNSLVKFKIVEAQHGQLAEPNHVYIAPGGKQMGVELKKDKLMIKVTDDEPVNRHKPSVDYLFESLAKIQNQIPQLIGVILTGMGSDGAKGLKLLRDQGAFTIGQNEATSVVYGMPKVAYEIGAVEQQLPLDKIPQGIMNALSKASIRKAS